MDPSLRPDELGTTSRGIERFYPPRVVAEAHESDEMLVGMKPNKPYSVAADELSRGKRRLLDRLLMTSNPDELKPLVETVVNPDNLVRGPATPRLALPGIMPGAMQARGL